MEFYLLSHGAEEYEVFPEKRSASTYENMLYSKQVIDALQPDASVAFATTNYPVFRSDILAINKRAHIGTAIICAAVCLVLGVLACRGITV